MGHFALRLNMRIVQGALQGRSSAALCFVKGVYKKPVHDITSKSSFLMSESLILSVFGLGLPHPESHCNPRPTQS